MRAQAQVAQAASQEGQAQAAIGLHPQPVSTTRTQLLTTALRHKQASSALKITAVALGLPPSLR